MKAAILIILISFSNSVIYAQSLGQSVKVTLETGEKINARYHSETKQNFIITNANRQHLTIPKYKILEIEVLDSDKSTTGTPLVAISEDKNLSSETRRNSLYFGLGYGAGYGGFGTNLTLKINSIALSGGIGYFPAELIASAHYAEIDYLHGSILYSGGLKFFIGRKQNWYFDAQYGAIGVYAQRYSYGSGNHYTTQRTLYGLSGLFGFDLFFNQFVGLNMAAGISRIYSSTPGLDTNYTIALNLGLLIRPLTF
jgi:hypothetical protein